MARGDESVSVRDYVDALLNERDKRHTQRDHFVEKAIDTALVSINQRLALLNELRANVATKDQLISTDARISDIKSSLDVIAGMTTGKGRSWALLVTIVSVTAGLSIIVGFILAHIGVGS